MGVPVCATMRKLLENQRRPSFLLWKPRSCAVLLSTRKRRWPWLSKNKRPVYPRSSFLSGYPHHFSEFPSATSAHDLSSWRLILCPLYIRRCLPIRLLLLAGGCSTPSHAAIDRKPSLPNARHEKFRVAWGRMKVTPTHPKVDFTDIQGRGARI